MSSTVAEVIVQVVQVRLEVGTAALLTGFDQHDAAAVGDAVGFHRLDGEQGGERRVAVVGDAARVDPVAAAHRLEGRQALGPVAEGRLLVEVTVEHGRAVARRRRGDGDDEDRRAVAESADLDVEVGDFSRERPVESSSMAWSM